MKIKLKVSNIVFTGGMPFKHKLNQQEVSDLIRKSELGWQLINDEISPIIRRFVKKEGRTVRKREKNAHISIWVSGAIVITGVTSRKEANEYYKQTIKDLNKFCKRVLK